MEMLFCLLPFVSFKGNKCAVNVTNVSNYASIPYLFKHVNSRLWVYFSMLPLGGLECRHAYIRLTDEESLLKGGDLCAEVDASLALFLDQVIQSM
jgi:hypothetical protein